MNHDQETDEFMRRLAVAAPGLSEEQVESIRRVVAGPEPAGDRPVGRDLGVARG
jgi:hypothetical protein